MNSFDLSHLEKALKRKWRDEKLMAKIEKQLAIEKECQTKEKKAEVQELRSSNG